MTASLEAPGYHKCISPLACYHAASLQMAQEQQQEGTKCVAAVKDIGDRAEKRAVRLWRTPFHRQMSA